MTRQADAGQRVLIMTSGDRLCAVRMDLADAFESAGLNVTLCTTPAEARAALTSHPFSLIVLDVVLPDGDGLRLLQEIRVASAAPKIPIFLLSPEAEVRDRIKGLNTGANEYVGKPYDRSYVVARALEFEGENRVLREQVLERELQALAAKSARELAEIRAAFIQELERKSAELEVFSYSISHDLRAPLRSIDGFSRILTEDHGADLNPQALDYLHRVRQAANRMGELIDALLLLSRVGRAQLRRDAINLSPIAGSVFEQLQQKESGRRVALRIEGELLTNADSQLMRVVFENLLGNAWKFTSKTENACIEIGVERTGEEEIFFVRDNGAGFDMSCAKELFQPFRRMHDDADFPGTGIGLATVHRIVERHGGRIWAHSEVGAGAIFHFTLCAAARHAGETPAPQSLKAADFDLL